MGEPDAGSQIWRPRTAEPAASDPLSAAGLLIENLRDDGSIRRLPLWFAITGAAFKAALIVGWRVSKSGVIYRFVMTYDPVSVWLADASVRTFFGSDKFAPSSTESLLFEVILVAAFTLQLYIVGLLLRSVLRLVGPNAEKRT